MRLPFRIVQTNHQPSQYQPLDPADGENIDIELRLSGVGTKEDVDRLFETMRNPNA
jgi:hypothetical protein